MIKIFFLMLATDMHVPGSMGGKKKGLSPDGIKKSETAVMLYKGKKSAEEIADIIGVDRSTVYRYLEALGQKRNL